MSFPFLRRRISEANRPDISPPVGVIPAAPRDVARAVPEGAPNPPAPEPFEAPDEEATLRAVFAALNSVEAQDGTPEPEATAEPEPPEQTQLPHLAATDEPPPPDVLAEASADAVAEAPADTAAEAPAETPADAAAEAPAEATAETPAELPVDIAACIPAEVPAEASAETLPIPPAQIADDSAVAEVLAESPALPDLREPEASAPPPPSDEELAARIAQAAGAVPADPAPRAPRSAALRGQLARAFGGFAATREDQTLMLARALPVFFIILAALGGGVFSVLALAIVVILALREPALAESAARNRASLHADVARTGPVVLALHALTLGVGLAALAGLTGLGLVGWIATFVALAVWIARVSLPWAMRAAARRERLRRGLATAVLATMLYGQRATAERLIRPRFAATPDDPMTASLGESVYDFALRSWVDSLIAGVALERALMRPLLGRRRGMVPPVVTQIGGGVLTMVVTGLVFGPLGLMSLILLAAAVQVQAVMADYLRHYGLTRRSLPDGRIEPLSARHTWTAPHLFSGRTSATADAETSPSMPYPMPVMAALALWPRRWGDRMDAPLIAAAKRARHRVA